MCRPVRRAASHHDVEQLGCLEIADPPDFPDMGQKDSRQHQPEADDSSWSWFCYSLTPCRETEGIPRVKRLTGGSLRPKTGEDHPYGGY